MDLGSRSPNRSRSSTQVSELFYTALHCTMITFLPFSYAVPSHPILSYLTVWQSECSESFYILSLYRTYTFLSYPILSHPILPYPIPSHPINCNVISSYLFFDCNRGARRGVQARHAPLLITAPVAHSQVQQTWYSIILKLHWISLNWVGFVWIKSIGLNWIELNQIG